MSNKTTVLAKENTFSHIKAYFELLKARLSMFVVFSGGIAYMIGNSGSVDMLKFIMFLLGGFMITGAANIINQVKEIKYDQLMSRTKGRPLPTGRMSVTEAIAFSMILTALSVFLFVHFVNVLTCLIALSSFILYAFVYTPLKRVGPIAVFVGAIPGALPPLLGWTAATGAISYEGLLLFAIQFIWQFPHFWAIAWVAHDDYSKAGFRLLPSSGGRDLQTAFNIMIYTLFLIPIGILPSMFGIVGTTAGYVATICGFIFLVQTAYLMKTGTKKAALGMMFGSFLYLPIVQIAFLWDKI